MINEQQVPGYLEKTLPELSDQLHEQDNCKNVYSVMNILLNYTNANIEKQDYNVVNTCFKLAENFYNKGTIMVKNAVENVFIYSLSTMFSDNTKANQIIELVPDSIYNLYVHQMLSCNL